MSNPILVAQDLSLYTLTATSTNPNYPLDNLKSYIITDIWISGTKSVNQFLKVDFGTPTEIDSIVIENHNFEYLGFEPTNEGVVLQYSDDDINYYNIAWIEDNFSKDPVYRAFTSQTKRYWRIVFSRNASELLTYPQIGNIFLAKKCDLGRPYDFPFQLLPKSYKTSVTETLSGIIRTSKIIGSKYLFEFTWLGQKGGVTDSVISEFQRVFNLCKGRLRPLYFVDTDGSTIIYCHFNYDDDPSLKYRVNVNEFVLKLIGQY